MLTQAELKQLLIYDADTGQFTRLVSATRSDRIGEKAGALNGFGHRQIRLNGKLYMAHRLAWLYVYGEWPETNLDHINGSPDDNRIINLRLATSKQNQENVKLRVDNASGYRGVNWSKSERKWVARVQHHTQRILVGKFDILSDAVNAVKEARNQLYTHNKTEYAA